MADVARSGVARRAGLEFTVDGANLPALIGTSAFVVWGQAMAEPCALTRTLMAQCGRFERLQIFVGISWSESVGSAGAAGIGFHSYCGAARNRLLGGALEIWPVPYSSMANGLLREKPVLFLQLAPGPTEDEFYLGAAAEYLLDLLPGARFVVGEVNAQAPRAGPTIRRDALDAYVRVNEPLASAPAARPSEVESAVARRVADLIPDGGTLQLGLGGVPAAVLPHLGRHRDLGIHSGLIGDGIVELIEAGVVTNARKTLDRGLTVTGLLAGTGRLAAWADTNPALALRPTSYTHGLATLGRLDRFIAVNSAIEVDLTGQVNAETARGRYVGAVGGATDFLRGAHASRGGLPIIALPSMAGNVSRIVPQLDGPTSIARGDAGLFVTEYGVADLRGLNERARARAMIAIADPGQRELLERAAARV